MLALTLLHVNGRFSFNGGSQSFLDLALMNPIPAHQLGIIVVASGFTGPGNGPSTAHDLQDSLGTVYTRVAEISRVPESGFRPGVTLSIWMVRPAVTIPLGTVLTCDLGGSVACGIIMAETWNTVSPLNAVSLVGVNADDGNTGGASFPAINLVPPGGSGDFVWMGVGAFDGDDNITMPLPPGWVRTRSQVGNLGNNFTGLTAFEQYRLVEALEQRWQVDDADDRSWCMILAAFELVAPPTGPQPAGTRQFEADFDTATDGTLGTTTAKRPDAVALDYLTAFAMGPSVLGGSVPDMRPWRARHLDPGTVQLAVGNLANTDWGAWVDLFSYSGAPIEELDLAFHRDGTVVVVAQRATGTAGAPEVWIYRWDEGASAYTFTMLDAGRTPRCCLDVFPHLSAHCAPTPDVQVIYLHGGGGPEVTGLVRRESSDAYATRHGSPLPYVENIWLEDLFPTQGRRMSTIYSRRDIRHGTMELRRVDSLPYDDSLLKRPHFQPFQPSDLTFFRGEFYTNPPSSTAGPDPVNLRVKTVDDVDTIELQCSDTVPGGFQPDSGAPWTVQVQEAPAPMLAGASHDFVVNVTHGNGDMTPKAFRARTRKVVGATTCWSPWRYWIPIPYGDVPSVTPTLVNCGHDALVPIPPVDVWEFASGALGPHVCESEAQVTGAAFGTEFVGGWNPGTGGGWRQDWSAQIRRSTTLSFSDPDLLFFYPAVSKAYAAFGSGGGWTLPDPEQQPLEIP